MVVLPFFDAVDIRCGQIVIFMAGREMVEFFNGVPLGTR